MGAASRKTWLEKQSDDVQFDVINWDAAGWTAEQTAAALKERHEIEVSDRTLSYSLQVMHVDGGLRSVRMLNALFKRNPDMNASVLTKAFNLTQAASEEFRRAKLDPTGVIISAQQERRLDIAEFRGKLEERKVAAAEETNRIKREALDLTRERMTRAREKLKDVAEDEDAKPEEIRRAARELYGLLDPAGHDSAASLPTKMDR